MAALWLDFKFGCPVCLRLQKRVSLQVNSCVLVFCMLLKTEFSSSSCAWFWSCLEYESLTVDTQDLLSACVLVFHAAWFLVKKSFADDCITLMLLLAGVSSLQGFIFLAQLKATVQDTSPLAVGWAWPQLSTCTAMVSLFYVGEPLWVKIRQRNMTVCSLSFCNALLHFPSK